MLITRQSPFSGKMNSIEINVSQEQLERWERGEDLIQRLMPNLSADEREFIMTGNTKEDWETMFPPEEDSALQEKLS